MNNFFRIIRLCANRYVLSDGFNLAAALSFTTLVSIVPIMVIFFQVVMLFPDYVYLGDKVNLAILNVAFVNNSEMLPYFEEFNKHSGELSLGSLAFHSLVYSCL